MLEEEEERLTDNDPVINRVTISNEINNEQPAKPFRITMELPLFLVMLGMSLSSAATSNLLLYRTCVHSFDYSREACKVFLTLEKNTHPELESEIQRYLTAVSTVRSVIEGVLPAILSLFLGVWSDTHGRKPLIVWPMFGITMSSVLLVLYCSLDNLGPWWHILTIVPYTMCGGFTIFLTGAFCYISDITTAENRSLRMTIMEGALYAGSIVGALLSPNVLRLVGTTWLIVIMAVINVIAYSFTNICVKESLMGAVEGGISTVLNFLLVKETMRECFKRRPNNGRAQLLLLTLANSFQVLIIYGVISLEYLYTREKLHWTLKEASLFNAVSTTISFVGTFVGIGLQKLLGINDMIITSIAFLTAMVDNVIRAVAVVSWHMYLGAAISVFKGLPSPLIRSFLTKILPVEDIAKAIALMSAIEGLCPLLAPLLYNSLYWCTISFYPGAIYFLSSGINGICLICVIFVQYFRWNSTGEYQHVNTAAII